MIDCIAGRKRQRMNNRKNQGLIREESEQREREILAPGAALSINSRGRQTPEDACRIRTVYQRDRDRIVHSKSFRRLKGKTQVFLAPEGDHYRTRMTHTIEVSQIARTIAKALRLNEDLTEAVALGHDLGHTPFGHAGEDVLNRLLPGGFSHHEQSVRVVELLEKGGRGLNLTWEARNAIGLHSKGRKPLFDNSGSGLPATLEGQVVRLADVVAYVNHDLDDAIRASILVPQSIPADIYRLLGTSHRERINSLVLDIITETQNEDLERIGMSREKGRALEDLRDFLYEKVYFNPANRSEFEKAEGVMTSLWEYCTVDGDRFYRQFRPGRRDDEPLERTVADVLAGMTDAYALAIFDRLFIPDRRISIPNSIKSMGS